MTWLLLGLLATATVAAPTEAPPQAPAQAPAQAPPRAAWRPTAALVVEIPMPRRRVPITADPVAHALAVGTIDLENTPPIEGDVFVGPDGAEHAWTRVEANDKGVLEVPRSGWALIAFESEESYDAMLDPGPSTVIFVNGRARAGDTYRQNTLEHPMYVRKGRNTLLYKLGRGNVRPVIRPAPDPITISGRDRTVPHARLGEPVDAWVGLVVVNASQQAIAGAIARTTAPDGTVTVAPLARIEPRSTIKVPFHVRGPAPEEGAEYEVVCEVLDPAAARLADARIKLGLRKRADWFKRTYLSAVDGSVQYYAMRESTGPDDGASRGLIVSLHGAGVQATGQIPNYKPRDWAHVVATTNRRPFGFDHEDWGRMEMLEAIGDIETRYPIDANRVHVTGHSMGGHGAWINGLADAGRWASVGPSSGWATFWTYQQSPRIDDDGGTGTILRRAANVSDTLLLLDNAPTVGIYVLHSENDNTVPVREARTMRERLGAFHADWAYYERPGAGHWWGAPCLDWPPMIEFMRAHQRPENPRKTDFTVIDPHQPGLVTRGFEIVAQHVSRVPSRVQITRSKKDDAHAIRGTTQNVARLALDVPNAGTEIEMDGTSLAIVDAGRVVLTWDDETWSIADDGTAAAPLIKSTRLPSGFKSVFARRPFLVYGTIGTAAENAWGRSKTRFDAETFRYRGNGRLEVISDIDYVQLPAAERADRNVVLYGSADTNRAWKTVIGRDAPFDVRRGVVRIGDRTLTGSDHAVMLCYPASPDGPLVGVVGGSGLPGLRTTTLMRFFLSGAHFPDWTVCTPDVLEHGWEAVSGCGFFDSRWQYDETQSAWARDTE